MSKDATVQKVQTARLRQQDSGTEAVIVTVSDAIQAAGLEDGGSFRFVPSSVEETGMLAVLGSEESADGRSDRYARNIRQEGRGQTRSLVIPPDALRELLDPESIDWEDPPEVDVWAGDRMLAFDLAEPEERTVNIDPDAGSEEETNG
jgi:hypothetical protein